MRRDLRPGGRPHCEAGPRSAPCLRPKTDRWDQRHRGSWPLRSEIERVWRLAWASTSRRRREWLLPSCRTRPRVVHHARLKAATAFRMSQEAHWETRRWALRVRRWFVAGGREGRPGPPGRCGGAWLREECLGNRRGVREWAFGVLGQAGSGKAMTPLLGLLRAWRRNCASARSVRPPQPPGSPALAARTAIQWPHETAAFLKSA